MVRPLLTYQDTIDLMVEFATAHGAEARHMVIRRAILDAYAEIGAAHRWNSLFRTDRVITYPRQTTGTVAYVHTGGTYERQLTLTGGTWPAWAADGAVRFGSSDLVCDIEERKSDTVVTLNATMNPGQDVASCDYSLYQRWLWLPADFRSFTVPMGEESCRFGREISLTDMLAMDRYNSSTGDILYHTIAEVPDVFGRKALYVYPQPDATRSIDFAYLRWPRELRYSGYDAADYQGTITVTADSAAVTGSGTAFSSDMIGSIFRIGADATNRPTNRFGGDYPFAEERSIVAVTDATHLTLDGVVVTARTGVKYVVTDPIDLGRAAEQAFLRECEAKLAYARNLMRDERTGLVSEARRMARDALLDAMAADNTSFSEPGSGNLPSSFLDGDADFSGE